MLYDSGDYERAEKLFEELNNHKPSNSSYFYLGVCYLQNNKFKMAITHFEKASSMPQEPWKSYTKWYLSLAYLKVKEEGKAKKVLLQLTKEGGFMKNKANELLEKID